MHRNRGRKARHYRMVGGPGDTRPVTIKLERMIRGFKGPCGIPSKQLRP